VQFDRIKGEGFQVIEIFAPAEGLRAYNGLDTKNHYRIDPDLGTMDDFRRLVRLAHSKGLAVVIFHNIGYHSAEAPDWLEACDLKKAGKTEGKVKWFLWADKPDAPPPLTEDSEFYVANSPAGDSPSRPATWGWQRSERAGCYYWARWEARTAGGGRVGLPADNWGSEERTMEAERIMKAWMDTGIDGMLLDAPLFYPGLTWEKNNRAITDVILSYGNTMVQPEGGRTLPWITEGKYNCIQEWRRRACGTCGMALASRAAARSRWSCPLTVIDSSRWRRRPDRVE
jgi:glycosidase